MNYADRTYDQSMGKGNDPNCAGAADTAAPIGNPTADLQALPEAKIDELWAQAATPVNRMRAALHETRKGMRQRGRSASSLRFLQERERELQAKIEELSAALAPFEAEWERRGGWTRAYLVMNDDGHIHRSTHCSTLRPSTLISWLPELSGKTEDEIIDHAGHMACTVCYPDAPTRPSFQRGLKQAEEEKARKAAGRCPGSGTPGENIDWRRYRPCGRCPQCGGVYGVTSTGKLRAHKPRKDS